MIRRALTTCHRYSTTLVRQLRAECSMAQYERRKETETYCRSIGNSKRLLMFYFSRPLCHLQMMSMRNRIMVKMYKLCQWWRTCQTNCLLPARLSTPQASFFGKVMSVFNFIVPFIPDSSHSTLPQFQQFFMVMMKLCLNLDDQYLAYCFNVHNSTVSQYFRKGIEVMYMYLRQKPLIKWPACDESALAPEGTELTVTVVTLHCV